MKGILIALAASAAVAASGMTAAERQHLRNLAQRPRCEARERVVAGGVTNIVETWRRGGYEWRQTNEVRRIVGRAQTNTFEQKVAEARAAVERFRAQLQEMSGRAEVAEARAARLDAFRAWLLEQRDAAKLATTKAIYQAIIDRLDKEGGE